MQLFYIQHTNDYEISHDGKLVAIVEGGAGEIAPGPISVSFGETRWSKWPDACKSGITQIYSSAFVDQFKNAKLTGVEWYPVIIRSNYNRRLAKHKPPTYFWARITGRIRTNPYYTELVPTDQKYADGSSILEPKEIDRPIVLDPTGCKVIDKPESLWLQHRIIQDSWDGSDWMRVLPTAVHPTELISQRVADLFQTLKIENATLYPIGKNRGL